MATPSPLITAIQADAYDWLERNAPVYLSAIEKELDAGATPADIRRVVSLNIGADRQALAMRCEQAARHIQAS